MKILIFWDIYGRIWRKALASQIELLQEKYSPDFTIANIENCTSWRGPVEQHAKYIKDLGVDVMTTGDHVYDNIQNIQPYLNDTKNAIIRPANFYESEHISPAWRGYHIVEKEGKKLAVIQLLWEHFMSHKVDSPFMKLEELLVNTAISSADAIIVDFHRETTAELYGMAHIFDGKLSCVYGTHTHIQTNDAQILDGGTALIADVGMNGPAYSVIGADPESVKKRFMTGIQKWKIEQSLRKDYVINAVYIEVDETNGEAQHIENISLRKKLVW